MSKAEDQIKQRKQARKRIDAAKVRATKPAVLDTSRKQRRKRHISELLAAWTKAWHERRELQPTTYVRKAPLSLSAFLAKWREKKVSVFPLSETRASDAP